MRLDRLITVLEAIAVAGKPLNASELHEMTDLPLPTCYRLLNTLRDNQLLETPADKNEFVIGQRLIRLTTMARTDTDICNITGPVLSQATESFGASVFLSRLRKSGVSIIHVETPTDPVTAYIHPGLGHRPMHACSCAKVLAAFSDDAIRELVLDAPMKSYTDHTHTRRDTLESDFEQIRKTGFAECVEEIELGISSVAAPVTLKNAGSLFSVGTIGSVRRFTPAYRRKIGKQLTHLADDVASAIDHSAWS